jgi:hypothetical protein
MSILCTYTDLCMMLEYGVITCVSVCKWLLCKITFDCYNVPYTMRSESHCALRLQYLDLVVSIEVAVDV